MSEEKFRTPLFINFTTFTSTSCLLGVEYQNHTSLPYRPTLIAKSANSNYPQGSLHRSRGRRELAFSSRLLASKPDQNLEYLSQFPLRISLKWVAWSQKHLLPRVHLSNQYYILQIVQISPPRISRDSSKHVHIEMSLQRGYPAPSEYRQLLPMAWVSLGSMSGGRCSTR